MSCKVRIQVIDYIEADDQIIVYVDMPDAPCGGGLQTLDAVAFACMVREWGEPSEFVGRTIDLEF